VRVAEDGKRLHLEGLLDPTAMPMKYGSPELGTWKRHDEGWRLFLPTSLPGHTLPPAARKTQSELMSAKAKRGWELRREREASAKRREQRREDAEAERAQARRELSTFNVDPDDPIWRATGGADALAPPVKELPPVGPEQAGDE